jgi:hypothetical protein
MVKQKGIKKRIGGAWVPAVFWILLSDSGNYIVKRHIELIKIGRSKR